MVGELASLGFDLQAVGEQLSDEGVAKFTGSFEGLLAALDEKRRSLRG